MVFYAREDFRQRAHKSAPASGEDALASPAFQLIGRYISYVSYPTFSPKRSDNFVRRYDGSISIFIMLELIPFRTRSNSPERLELHQYGPKLSSRTKLPILQPYPVHS